MTPPPVAYYLAALLRRLQTRVGERLEAAWLAGSTALGDFDPVRSDIDVQAVTAGRLPRPELEALAADLSHPRLPCPVRGLEFVLYAREDLGGMDGPAFQLNLNTGPGMTQHAGYDPGAEPRFWFILDVAIARQRARPLHGPPPAHVLPVLPRALVLRALGEALAFYRAHDGGEAMLAACRAWAWAAEGQWLSKAEAAGWAAARLPDAAPVDRVLARRADPGLPGPSAEEAAAVLGRVERVLAAEVAALNPS